MDFWVKILGCSSATPLANRFPTAQLLIHKDQYFLLDCGEGTQIQLRRQRIKFQRINHIFISHLHGDHFFGLVGLLSTMHLLGREKELELYCPKDLKKIIELQLACSQTYLKYRINYHFHEDEGAEICETKFLRVEKVECNHRIPCWGFIFREKELGRKIRDGVVKEFGIPFSEIENIRFGADYRDHLGKVISNIDLTKKSKESRSYAFITDNRITEDFDLKLNNVSTMYHEATFLTNLRDRAKATYHSTSDETATLAEKLNLTKLIIGHFSSRYMDHELKQFIEEISEVFPNVILGLDGSEIEIL